MSVVYLGMFYCVVVYLGPFLCIVSFRCCVFCLLVVLVELSVLAKWLVSKTPLRKPNRAEGIISIKPRPKSAHDFLAKLYCFIVLLCIYVVSCPYVIYYPTVIARYSLFVLKVPLNPKQTNKQTNLVLAFPVYHGIMAVKWVLLLLLLLLLLFICCCVIMLLFVVVVVPTSICMYDYMCIWVKKNIEVMHHHVTPCCPDAPWCGCDCEFGFRWSMIKATRLESGENGGCGLQLRE